MPEPRPRTAVLCGHDPAWRSAIRRTLHEAGFTVEGEVDGPLAVVSEVAGSSPGLVVLDHLATAADPLGLGVVRDLHEASPDTEVVLVATDLSIAPQVIEGGAFAVTRHDDLDMLVRVLAEVGELLDTGERRTPTDRRTGLDRRVDQDWSKVTHERRGGTDRRQDLRRTDDVAELAREAARRATHRPPDDADPGDAD